MQDHYMQYDETTDPMDYVDFEQLLEELDNAINS